MWTRDVFDVCWDLLGSLSGFFLDVVLMSLGASLVASWELFGILLWIILAILGSFFVAFWDVLVNLRTRGGRFGASFEASWGPPGGPLGLCWAPLGASWEPPGAEGSNCRFVFLLLGPLGAVLGPS